MKNRNWKSWIVSFLLVPVVCIAFLFFVVVVGMLTTWLKIIGDAIVANTPAVLGWSFVLVLVLIVIRISGLAEMVLDQIPKKKTKTK